MKTHEDTMEAPWGHHGGTLDPPRKLHVDTMEAPRRQHEPTTEAPGAHHTSNMDTPRRHQGHTTELPWTNHDGYTTEAPWTHHGCTIDTARMRHRDTMEAQRGTTDTPRLNHQGGTMNPRRKLLGDSMVPSCVPMVSP